MSPCILWLAHRAHTVIVNLRPVVWPTDFSENPIMELLCLNYFEFLLSQNRFQTVWQCTQGPSQPRLLALSAASPLLLSPLSHWPVQTGTFMWLELSACSSIWMIEPHVKNVSLTVKPVERPLLCEALPGILGWVMAPFSLLQRLSLVTWVFLHWTPLSDLSHLSYPILYHPHCRHLIKMWIWELLYLHE